MKFLKKDDLPYHDRHGGTGHDDEQYSFESNAERHREELL